MMKRPQCVSCTDPPNQLFKGVTTNGCQYQLLFNNESTNEGNVCIYQTDPNIGVPNVLSLAWFSKYTHPTTSVDFSWEINYNFVWANTGILIPGVLFGASQAWEADLENNNQVSLNFKNGAYTFEHQTQGPEDGNLYIKETKNIPLKQASVGVGMSGKGTFVVQAQPNFNLAFSPHPQYWITFGTFKQGEVLDVGQITNKAPVSGYSLFGLHRAIRCQLEVRRVRTRDESRGHDKCNYDPSKSGHSSLVSNVGDVLVDRVVDDYLRLLGNPAQRVFCWFGTIKTFRHSFLGVSATG